MRWTRNNKNYSTKVKLNGVVPQGFYDGIIYFVFNQDDNIAVKTSLLVDIDARVKIESQ